MGKLQAISAHILVVHVLDGVVTRHDVEVGEVGDSLVEMQPAGREHVEEVRTCRPQLLGDLEPVDEQRLAAVDARLTDAVHQLHLHDTTTTTTTMSP